jgi:hypothetical protein
MPVSRLAEIGVTYPGWRGWRTPEGEFAARKGGTAPPGVQARGQTLAELMGEIAAAVRADDDGSAPPPVLRPYEQAVLTAVQIVAEPLPTRAVSDASGVPISTTARALATLCIYGLVIRHREGRMWLYTCAATSRTSPAGRDATEADANKVRAARSRRTGTAAGS